MYQTLIWALVLGDDPGRMGTALDAEDGEGLTDPLVDRVRRDFELGRDFLRREQLIDEPQAIELPGGQPSDPLGHRVFGTRA
jgi:hypothetical protein